MAGHSKWANIKIRKGAQDAKRGKIFTKLIREISVAAKMGGAEENANPRLREAINKALKANMKRDTIENAIKRGAGDLDNVNMVEMRYEGYGPGGVAILVKCLSDNKNRTVSDVRHAFVKYGGNLGTEGSVAYLFQDEGEIILAPQQAMEAAIDLAIEAGAQDVNQDAEVTIITDAEHYHIVLDTLKNAGYIIAQSQLTMGAHTQVQLAADDMESLIKLIDLLEDLDDVQEVYTNAQFDE